MNKQRPLSARLYEQPQLFELARIIGYTGMPLTDAQKAIEPLAKKYGKEVMAAAAEEIVRIDTTTNSPTARLTDQARKLCWQLLGPPPEHPWFDLWKKPEPLPNSWDKPKEPPAAEPKSEKPARTRKKKSA